MQLTPEKRAELITEIVQKCDYRRMVLGSGKVQLTEGCLVVISDRPRGASNPDRYIGYCVQVRKKRGQFGSDMVFIRHPDGMLVTHENQGFYVMSPEQEALAKPLFAFLPEDEDFAGGFTCMDKVHEVGFIIENSASRPSPDTPFTITVTTVK